MKSATAISYELDDIVKAAEDLTSQIKSKFTFGKHTVALLFGQPDMEIGALSAAVSRELGCHVVGGTTAAGALLTNEGYHELAIMLHVLSGDDCFFAVAISDSLTADPEKKISDAYREACRNLEEVYNGASADAGVDADTGVGTSADAGVDAGASAGADTGVGASAGAEPKMVVCVASIVPGIASDCILEKISALCGNLPVFGFNAADDFEFSKQQVYLDGETGGDRIAILLLSGNVRPIFQTTNLAGKQALEKRLVTKSRDNVICEIEGKPAFEYIKSFPFINDETTALFNYQFFVEMQNDVLNDGIPVSRALNTYDKETGEVTCFANVPENSYIGLLYCDGNDVAKTSEAGIKDFLGKLQTTGGDYIYSTVLIATCSLRNMFLADMRETEGDLVKALMPPNLTTSGVYAFGEIAPTSIRGGEAVNRFHNATFTLCAI